MKGNDLFLSLSLVDEELTARAQERMTGECKHTRRGAWKRLALAAACVCLCVSILVALIPPKDSQISDEIPLVHRVENSNLSIPTNQTYLYSDSWPRIRFTAAPGSHFNYLKGDVIVAKVIEVLPDEYSDPVFTQTWERRVDPLEIVWGNTWENDLDLKFHILRLRVEQVISDQDMPREIYYMLPSYASTDLMEYDEMIFFVSRRSMGEYLMSNQTQGRAETFSPMYSSNKWHNPYQHVGSVMAFSNGKLDVSLWEKEGWLVPYENHIFWDRCTLDDFLQKDETSPMTRYPAFKGCSLKKAIRMIKEYRSDMAYDETQTQFLTYADLTVEGLEEVLDYVEPFTNGTFAHYGSEKTLHYFRVINGFFTREEITVHIDTGEIVYSGEAFSKEDIERLPNLSDFLARLDISALETGHLTKEILENLELDLCRTTAWYTKYNGEAYGVVKVYWQYSEIDETQNLPYCDDSYYDDLYYLFSTDGSVRIVNRDELRTCIGDDNEIEFFEYNVPQNSYPHYH